MRRTTRVTVVVALVGLLSFLAAGASAAEQAVMSDKALAEQYTKEAAALRQKIEQHETMLRAYENGPRFEKSRQHGNLMGRHCKELIDEYSKAAANAEALAKEHSSLAAGQ